MPDNDSDLAAWGMRYALIPIGSFMYAVISSIVILLLRAIISKFAVFRKVSATGN